MNDALLPLLLGLPALGAAVLAVLRVPARAVQGRL